MCLFSFSVLGEDMFEVPSELCILKGSKKSVYGEPFTAIC